MRAFDEFRESVQPLQKEILAAQAIDYRRMTAEDWRLLEEIFRAIKIMASGTSLVGNSKVMAHMMPNIVPPIDREYTLRYLRGRTNMANDPSIEWALMKGIIADFFIPVATDPGFASSAERWMADPSAYAWDTAILKVIDNLVIGARK